MQDKVRQELYEEIARILPEFEYCLAPKKVLEKKGASMFRSSGKQSMGTAESAAKDPRSSASMRTSC